VRGFVDHGLPSGCWRGEPCRGRVPLTWGKLRIVGLFRPALTLPPSACKLVGEKLARLPSSGETRVTSRA
jgi:hypothetical protein